MSNDVAEIVKHLENKHKYKPEYIERVKYYMEKNPDLAHEFHEALPKNHIYTDFISVKGLNARFLGSRTLLSRAAIYITLARHREENLLYTRIVEEELKNLEEGILR